MKKFRGRLRNLTDRENGSPGLEMSSLIDVSFLLLIYFLITSTLDPKEADLRTAISGDPTTPELSAYAGPGPISIHIAADGSVSAGGEILDADSNVRELPNLREKLSWAQRAWKLSGPADSSYGVIVRADDKANGQRFIDVMNCLAEVGISNVALDEFVE